MEMSPPFSGGKFFEVSRFWAPVFQRQKTRLQAFSTAGAKPDTSLRNALVLLKHY